ncbi:hypothetical protein GCM10008922_25120 [Faecalicatena contorta]
MLVKNINKLNPNLDFRIKKIYKESLVVYMIKRRRKWKINMKCIELLLVYTKSV